MDSLTYWKIREEKAKQNYIAEEEEYNKELAKIYNALLVTIETLINSFFQKYAKAEGITMAEALQKVAQMDVQAFQTKAKQYVQSRNFSKQANAELRLYNATMKINRLELLKANIGLEMIDSFNQMQGQFDANLLKRAADEFSRQAGILGMGVDKAPKMARAIVNASFHNADFSTRIWANQGQLRNELSILLSNGIVQGIHSRELAKQIEKKFGVSKSNAERLMRTEMARVQIAAQEESYRANGYEQYVFLAIGTACPGCLALNEQHFNVSEMQSGENAPPMHPNCRCSTAAWMDRAETMKQIKAMSQVKSTEKLMSAENKDFSGNIKWEKLGKKISIDEYKELAEYARKAGINLQGFKYYKGDISTIKEMIDDAAKIVKQYPAISGGRRSITICLDRNMNSADFAITNNHIIRINANAFENISQLKSEYNKLVEEGWFVNGTNYRAIVIHEMGHVVSNIYNIDGMQIVKNITGIQSTSELTKYIKENLSEYASLYENGQEIIAECFACVYNGSSNEFALRCIEECKKDLE